MSKDIENIFEQIINNIMNESKSMKVFDEGFLSINQLWTNITDELENRDIDISIVREFFNSDEELIKEIKKVIENFLKDKLRDLFIHNINIFDEDEERW